MTLEVALIPPVAHGRPSMGRYTDVLLHGFPGGEPHVRTIAPALTPLAGPAPRIDGYARRWITLPLGLRRAAADVFHITDQALAHLIRVLPAERTIVTAHDLMRLVQAEGEVAGSAERSWLGRFRWSVMHLSRAAAVVCPSETTRADVIRLCHVAPERTHVIRQAVGGHFRPLDAQECAQERRLLDGGARHLALHVTSGGFYKNVPMTLRAIALLREAGVDIALVRAGGVLNAEEAALAERLGVVGAVHDLGSVSEERLVRLYNAVDVLFFPSFYEGFGWPALEAMACGTPVVASNTPALVELLDGVGMQAPPDDAPALAEALRAVLDRPELAAQMRAAGLARAAGMRWPDALAAYAELWREVARSGSPAEGSTPA